MRYFNEIKVGIVVILGLVVMTFGYFWLRGVGLGADVYYVKLTGAAQIAQGNDVRLQGVKIGQVEEVSFDQATQQPILRLAVRRSKPEFKLLKTYEYSVQSAGLVGENYVDIRGKYNPASPIYAPNDDTQFIPGKASAGLLAVADSAQDIVKDLRGTIANLNVTLDRVNKGVLNYQNQLKLAKALDGVAKLTNSASQGFGPNGIRVGLADPAAQKNLNNIFKNGEIASQSAANAARNIEITSRDFGGTPAEVRGLVRDLRVTLGDSKGQVRGLFTGLNKTANNIAGITESLDFTLKQGGFKENSQLIFQSLRRATENIEVATGGFRKLATDEATQGDLKQTLTALRQSTEALRDTAQTIRNTLVDDKNKEQISGALTALGTTAKNLSELTTGLNKIVGDAQLQENVKGAAANLNSTLAATTAAAERINGLLGGKKPRKTGATSGQQNGAKNIGAPRDFPTGVDFTYRRYLQTPNLNGGSDVSGQNYGDLHFNGEFFGGPFRLGLDNIGDGDDVTLQSGLFIGQNAAIRYGLYRSKLGVGAELRKGKFSIEANAYNPNNRSYNLLGGVQVTKNLQLFGGRENLRGDGTGVVGVKITQ
ncbi:ABC-type transporter Mla maintaining outer membrane lipid asymmetry, component MlaD [Abditibacterium utsteinense]|uniref:ABC-type transporter Mla maintaining outer membrane lipid asymmetry, component MlaD n=1 Tax=Abditibacterium utsteinense TaxID=1960156 RepID=A0A2S8SQF3_9BACT|nr:MlaD family protein [Abditibacterium utsteinense]PQV63015.1 ABC-type transporter Mla maintaining outer membrane lipid asymmetry, component MlaD [Abditibacterium utsteinense]